MNKKNEIIKELKKDYKDLEKLYSQLKENKDEYKRMFYDISKKFNDYEEIKKQYKELKFKKDHPLKCKLQDKFIYGYQTIINLYIDGKHKGEHPIEYLEDKATEYEKKYKWYIANNSLYLYNKKEVK